MNASALSKSAGSNPRRQQQAAERIARYGIVLDDRHERGRLLVQHVVWNRTRPGKGRI